MTMYDDDRVVTLLREVDLPLSPPDRLGQVTRRARGLESRRMSALAGVMALVLAAGVVSALSVHNRSGTDQLTVAAAARATQDAGSARVTIRVTLAKSASPLLPDGELLSMSGPVDFRQQKLAFKGSFSKAPIEMRAIGKDRWIKSPEALLPGGAPAKPWVHSVEVASKGAADFASMDPARLLDVLTSKGTVVSRTQDGDRTKTVLRLPLDAFRTAFGSSPPTVSADVTVETDASGRIRKTTAETTLVGLGTSLMTISYDDFGIDVHVQPPPADQVQEASATTGSSGASQTFTLNGNSSPQDRKNACEQLKTVRAQMPAGQSEQEKKARELFDRAVAKACATG
ncbi:MAG: hypothetical protein JWO88_1976 [Frankiales bacterium]|nr:hypothetical protein [Frankiales bacterium]